MKITDKLNFTIHNSLRNSISNNSASTNNNNNNHYENSLNNTNNIDRISVNSNTETFKNNNATHKRKRRWPVLGKGIYLDLKDRLPYYIQDWKDSWDYRVIPSLIETFFNNLLPAIAFAQDMFDRTNNSYGVNEILLSSAMGGIVFGLLAGQPLCIVGVTGPISIFHYTVYEIIKPLETNYFAFMFWIDFWSLIFHLLLSITNAVALLQFVTTFPCDIFGLFNAIIYIQKGIQILLRQFDTIADTNTSNNTLNPQLLEQSNLTRGFASIMVALVMTVFGLFFKNFYKTHFLSHRLRKFISDYSTALSVLFWSAFVHFGGKLNDVHFQTLPITKAFHPTSHVDRNNSTWLAYSTIATRDIFIALPFGIILTILFYFDHSVSSLIAQKSQYKLTKPSSFHYDFALLGVTTCIAGVLGIPPPNGLIPQAPMHTESLLVLDHNNNVVRCVEQRFTNTVQGLLMLVMMSRPFLICLNQIPQPVLSGLFFIMGIHNLVNNEIILKITWFFIDPRVKNFQSLEAIELENRKDQESTDNSENEDSMKNTVDDDNNNALKGYRLSKVSTKSFWIYIALALLGFVGEFAISNTIAAIGFPLILLLTVLLVFIFPKIFTREEIEILDPPVAQKFTIKNLLIENLCPASSKGSDADAETHSIDDLENNPNHRDNQNISNIFLANNNIRMDDEHVTDSSNNNYNEISSSNNACCDSLKSNLPSSNENSLKNRTCNSEVDINSSI